MKYLIPLLFIVGSAFAQTTIKPLTQANIEAAITDKPGFVAEIGAGGTVDNAAVTMDNIVLPNYIAHKGATAIFPYQTMDGFEMAFGYGLPILEMDIHRLIDGGLAVMHDQTEVRLDGESATLSALTGLSTPAWKARVTASTGGIPANAIVGLFGWPTDYPALTMDQLFQRFGNKAILMPELKSAGCAEPLLRMLETYNIQKNMFIVQAGSSRHAELLQFAAAGWVTVEFNVYAGHASFLASGIEWTAFNWSETSAIAAAKAAGMKVACSTANRRSEAATALAAGADLIYTDEPLYVPNYTGNNDHRITSDPYDQGVTYHGHRIDYNSKVSVVDGGLLFDTLVDSVTYSCLLGWACPLADPTSWTLSFDARWDIVNNADRYFGIFIASDDRAYNLSGFNGYHVLVRQNGNIQIYKYTNGISDLGVTVASGTAVPLGSTASYQLTVTPTTVAISRTDGTDYTATLTDSAYRGAYITATANQLKGSIGNLTITP